MAVLNNIRKRGIFLIIIIAMALFAFILADLIGSGSFGRGNQTNIATINGKDVSYFEFSNRVQAYQQNMGGRISTIQAVNQLWDATLEQTLIEEQMEKLGIEVGNQQLINALAMQFSGSPELMTDGQFDINKYRSLLAQFKSIDPATYQQYVFNENNMAEQAKAEVYFDLLGAALGTTTAEAKELHRLNNTTFDLQYVKVPYSSIPDGDIEISDSKIKEYINAHKEEFTSNGTRDLRYVLFEEKATEEDELNVKNRLAELLKDHTVYNKAAGVEEPVKGFRNVEDYADYLSEHSDLGFTDAYLYQKDLPKNQADTLAKLNVGGIFGPYKEDGYWKYTKMVAHKEMPDSVNLKHILITYSGLPSAVDVDRTKAEAQELADSLLAEIKSDKDLFGEIAGNYSEDPNTKENGGEIGWVTYPRGEQNDFIKFAFENEAGAIDVIETQFGFHIAYVEDSRNKQQTYKIATLAKKIEPSEETIGDLFNQTTNFQVAAQDGDFTEAAEKENYVVRQAKNLKALDENITGIGARRNIVQWAFGDKIKVGEITRFETDKGYVVVQLTGKTSKGLASVDEARDRVKRILMKEKKAEKIINEIGSNKDMNDIASMYGTQARTKQGVDLENPDLEGKEPKVVGRAFGLDVNEVSNPIEGKNAVYVIKVMRKQDAEDIGSYNGIINRENERLMGEASKKVFEALKEKAKIEDKRAEFY